MTTKQAEPRTIDQTAESMNGSVERIQQGVMKLQKALQPYFEQQRQKAKEEEERARRWMIAGTAFLIVDAGVLIAVSLWAL